MPALEIVTDPEKYSAYLRGQLTRLSVPVQLHEGLVRYVVHGIPTGSFLLAVLANNLKEACERADLEVRYRLFDIVNFLYNEAPLECWGSTERVRAWLERPRIRHTKQDCDENCRQCAKCYVATGDSGCDKLCRHAAENYPDGWPE